MRSTRLRSALAAVAVSSTLLLAACGGSLQESSGAAASAPTKAAARGNGVEKLDATQILAKAQAASVAAKSVHVAGKAGTTAIDLSMGATASDSSVGINGQNVEVLWVGGAYYLKADAAAWTALGNAAAARLLAGKYAKLTPAMAAAYKTFTDMAVFFSSSFKSTGKVTKGEVTTVDGQRAVTLKDTADGSLLYIALDGPPYPIKSENKGAQAGVVTFTGWNQSKSVASPAAADVVDLAKL
jgi:hypothetical protein